MLYAIIRTLAEKYLPDDFSSLTLLPPPTALLKEANPDPLDLDILN